MRKIDREVIIRTIVLVIVLFNQLLVAYGKEKLPFTEDEIYSGVSSIATVLVSIWAWWKNNSFTEAAIEGDKLKNQLKSFTLSDHTYQILNKQ